MKCDKCGIDSEDIKTFTGIAGTFVSKEVDYQANLKITKTKYKDIEQISYSFCPQCFLQARKSYRRIRWIFLAASIIAFLSFFYFRKYIFEKQTSDIVTIIITFSTVVLAILPFALIILLIHTYRIKGTEKELEEIMRSYCLRKAEEAGHTILWTIEEFEKEEREGSLIIE